MTTDPPMTRGPSSNSIASLTAESVCSTHQLPGALWVRSCRCFPEVDGELFAFCDQDDIWLPHKLASGVHRLGAMAAQTSIAAISADAIVVDESRSQLAPSALDKRGVRNTPDLGQLLVTNAAIGATMMGTRALAAAAVAYEPEGLPMHDWWCAVVASAFGQFSIDATPVIEWRRHDRTVTGSAPSTIAGRLDRRRSYLHDSGAHGAAPACRAPPLAIGVVLGSEGSG